MNKLLRRTKMSKLKSFLDKPIMKDGGCVPRREGIWYGLGVAGQNISCGMVGWFYFFCTDVAYYNLGIIASVLTIARIWDAVNDPLMGVLIDRHRFKNGEKLRPWSRYRSDCSRYYGDVYVYQAAVRG